MKLKEAINKSIDSEIKDWFGDKDAKEILKKYKVLIAKLSKTKSSKEIINILDDKY